MDREAISYLFIFGTFFFAQIICTTCALYIASLFQRYQLDRPKYIQALVGSFSFTLGIILGWTIILFITFLASARGYGVLTVLWWLILTCALQILINIFMVCWNIVVKRTLSYYRWQIALFIICNVPAYIIAINS